VAHGGGIEGFSTSLIYAPDRRIAVVVLSNVNRDAPQKMSDQLLSVALDKPVVLTSEHKAVPVAKDQLTKFIGVFALSPAFSLTIAVAGDELTAQGTGQQALPLMYEANRMAIHGFM